MRCNEISGSVKRRFFILQHFQSLILKVERDERGVHNLDKKNNRKKRRIKKGSKICASDKKIMMMGEMWARTWREWKRVGKCYDLLINLAASFLYASDLSLLLLLLSFLFPNFNLTLGISFFFFLFCFS